jgi:hypothetical protein
MRQILRSDLEAAARGLRMREISDDELRKIAATHARSAMFASAVIAKSARITLTVREMLTKAVQP